MTKKQATKNWIVKTWNADRVIYRELGPYSFSEALAVAREKRAQRWLADIDSQQTLGSYQRVSNQPLA